jgi:hypothetical protein
MNTREVKGPAMAAGLTVRRPSGHGGRHQDALDSKRRSIANTESITIPNRTTRVANSYRGVLTHAARHLRARLRTGTIGANRGPGAGKEQCHRAGEAPRGSTRSRCSNGSLRSPSRGEAGGRAPG